MDRMAECINVEIVEVVTPENFMGREIEGRQMRREAAGFLDLCKRINQYCENMKFVHIQPDEFKENEICLGQGSDKLWHRVQIGDKLCTAKGQKASCFFVDKGCTEMILFQLLRKAPEHFLTTPFQLRKFSLYGLRPLSWKMSACETLVKKEQVKNWDESAINFMRDTIKSSKEHKAEVIFEDAAGTLFVRLYYTTSKGLFCFNDELKRLEYAISEPSGDILDECTGAPASPKKKSHKLHHTMEEYARRKQMKKEPQFKPDLNQPLTQYPSSDSDLTSQDEKNVSNQASRQSCVKPKSKLLNFNRSTAAKNKTTEHPHQIRDEIPSDLSDADDDHIFPTVSHNRDIVSKDRPESPLTCEVDLKSLSGLSPKTQENKENISDYPFKQGIGRGLLLSSKSALSSNTLNEKRDVSDKVFSGIKITGDRRDVSDKVFSGIKITDDKREVSDKKDIRRGDSDVSDSSFKQDTKRGDEDVSNGPFKNCLRKSNEEISCSPIKQDVGRGILLKNTLGSPSKPLHDREEANCNAFKLGSSMDILCDEKNTTDTSKDKGNSSDNSIKYGLGRGILMKNILTSPSNKSCNNKDADDNTSIHDLSRAISPNSKTASSPKSSDSRADVNDLSFKHSFGRGMLLNTKSTPTSRSTNFNVPKLERIDNSIRFEEVLARSSSSHDSRDISHQSEPSSPLERHKAQDTDCIASQHSSRIKDINSKNCVLNEKKMKPILNPEINSNSVDVQTVDDAYSPSKSFTLSSCGEKNTDHSIKNGEFVTKNANKPVSTLEEESKSLTAAGEKVQEQPKETALNRMLKLISAAKKHSQSETSQTSDENETDICLRSAAHSSINRYETERGGESIETVTDAKEHKNRSSNICDTFPQTTDSMFQKARRPFSDSGDQSTSEFPSSKTAKQKPDMVDRLLVESDVSDLGAEKTFTAARRPKVDSNVENQDTIGTRSILRKSTDTISEVQSTISQNVRFSANTLDISHSSEDSIDTQRDKLLAKFHSRKLMEKLKPSSKSSEHHRRVPDRLVNEQVLKGLPVGVLLHGSHPPRPCISVDGIEFAEQVHQYLHQSGVKWPRLIQQYTWPGIWRGRHCIGIGPSEAGKTLAYIPPLLTQIFQTALYQKLKRNGPIALILAPSWKKVNDIYDQCTDIIQARRNMKILALYGGGFEESQEIPLFNGCEILVATPPSLIRMLEKKCTELERLCHLVIEDADVTLEQFREEIKTVMDKFSKVLKDRLKTRAAPLQFLLFSSQWTIGIKDFIGAYLREPLVILSSWFEAAVYGNVKQIVHMVRESNQKMDKLIHLVESVMGDKNRLVIFTSNALEAEEIAEVLRRKSVFVEILDDPQDDDHTHDVLKNWKYDHKPGSFPVLVCTDGVLPDLDIRDASCVIHYDLPNSKTKFGNRVACMSLFYPDVTKSEEETKRSNDKTPPKVKPVSYVIVCRENIVQARPLIQMLKRIRNEIPPELLALEAGIKEGQDEDHNKNLCHFFKAFGKCINEGSCPDRHSFICEIDHHHRGVPTTFPLSGIMKVMIVKVVDATCFYGRILKHEAIKEDLSKEYIKITLDMNMWFSKTENRIPSSNINNGSLCAVCEGHSYYRVRVEGTYRVQAVGGSLVSKVWFVDEAKHSEVPVQHLLQLPVEMASVPYQAVEIIACRVKPMDKDPEWTPKANVFSADSFSGRALTGRIALRVGSTFWLDPLVERTYLKEVQTATNHMSVRLELKTNGLAVDNPEHLNNLYKACENKIEVPRENLKNAKMLNEIEIEVLPECHDYHHVFVSAIENPKLIFVQRRENEAMLNDFDDKVNGSSLLPDNLASDQVTVGTICLAKFNLDGRLYRARVTKITGDKVDVFAVDHGDKESLSVDNLYKVPEWFTLPFQAIECNIANISPLGLSWEECNIEALYDLTHFANNEKKELTAEVKSKGMSTNTGTHRYCIELHEDYSNGMMNIGRELVWRRHAEFETASEELIQRPDPDTELSNDLHKKISDVISQIYWNKNGSMVKELVENLMKMLQMEMKSKNELIGHSLKALYKLVCRIREPDVHVIILSCCVECALQCNKFAEEMFSEDQGRQLLLCLEKASEPDIQSQGMKAIMQLLHSESFRDLVEVDYLLRTCFDILLSTTNLEITEQVLRLLQKMLKNLHLNIEHFSRAEFWKTVQGHLDAYSYDSPNEGLLQAVLHLVSRLIVVSTLSTDVDDNTIKEIMREMSRESFVKSVIHILSKPFKKCLLHGLTFCLKLAESNRKKKTLLLELGIVHVINRIKSLPQCQEDYVQILLEKLLDSIVVKVQQSTEITVQKVDDEDQDQTSVRQPQVLWSQNTFRVLLNVKVSGIQEKDDSIRIEATKVLFSAKARGTHWFFNFDLFDAIVVSNCHIKYEHRGILISLRKVNEGKWKRLLKDGSTKTPFLSIDFDRIICSSSDSEGEKDHSVFLTKKKKFRGFPKKHKSHKTGACANYQFSSSDTSDSFSDDPYDVFGLESHGSYI